MAYEDTEDFKNLLKAQAREDANYSDPGSESMANFMKRTGTKANRPRATVGGPKIVTKEQMEKAGFDNLRDYMNAQKGLRRRDNFASEAQKRAFSATPRGTQTEGSEGEDMALRIAEYERAGTPNVGPMKKGGMVKKMKKGGKVKKMKSGGTVSSASKRADGIAQRGKTKGRFV